MSGPKRPAKPVDSRDVYEKALDDYDAPRYGVEHKRIPSRRQEDAPAAIAMGGLAGVAGAALGRKVGRGIGRRTKGTMDLEEQSARHQGRYDVLDNPRRVAVDEAWDAHGAKLKKLEDHEAGRITLTPAEELELRRYRDATRPDKEDWYSDDVNVPGTKVGRTPEANEAYNAHVRASNAAEDRVDRAGRAGMAAGGAAAYTPTYDSFDDLNRPKKKRK